MNGLQHGTSCRQFAADKGGDFGGSSFPAAAAPSIHENFDAISVRIIINDQPFDVAVPDETFNKLGDKQTEVAVQIGGRMATREESKVTAEYLLAREASYLLTQEQKGKITKEEGEWLKLHRRKWRLDKQAEALAKEAGAITEREAALLEVYRTKWVRDTGGVVAVDYVRVHVDDCDFYIGGPGNGALVVRPSAELK